VLPVTTPIAEAWGRLNPNAVTPLPPIDGLLAATTLVHGLTLVTRDVQPHERLGIPVVDPWVSSPA
jgi:predicted nucleic acid-binding protein